jgi:hypothetical protein
MIVMMMVMMMMIIIIIIIIPRDIVCLRNIGINTLHKGDDDDDDDDDDDNNNNNNNNNKFCLFLQCILIQNYNINQTKCAFPKSVFYFSILHVYYVFRTQGFIFRKSVVYIKLWYGTFYMHQYKEFSRWKRHTSS